MDYLKLKGAKSYRGKGLHITCESPECKVEDKALSGELQTTGYFELVRSYEFTPSVFTRDPSAVGGSNCNVKFRQYEADVSGAIEWYEADAELGRAEGCRVGFAIAAPADMSDVTGATYTYNGKTGLVAEDTAKDPRVLWWYPLAEANTESCSITVDWDPDGERPTETFTVYFINCQLQPKPQTEKDKLSVLLDSMTIPELKKYAENESIDLGSAAKKADIIEAIMSAKFPSE